MRIINLKSNKIKNSSLTTVNNIKKADKYFSPSNVEWHNSIYLYNKNNIKPLSTLDNVVLKIIRVYFNMYNIKAEKSVKLDRLTKRKRWLSSARKLWVGKLNLKHTNDKVFINIFIYDRINSAISMNLKLLFRKFYGKRVINFKKDSVFGHKNLEGRKFNNDKKIYKILMPLLRKSNIYLKNKLLDNVTSTLKKIFDAKLNNSMKIFIDSLRLRFLKRVLKQEMSILYYKKFIWLNTLKYKSTFIWRLQKLIGKAYNKKIVFNIVSLKNFYLNSDILTQILIHKSKDRNQRVYNIIGDALSIIEIPVIQKSMTSKIEKDKYFQNIKVKNNAKNIIKDNIDVVLKNYYNTDLSNKKHEVLNTINNKSVIGVRLEAAGRLTKRFTAQRAVKKVKYIGTLKNIDSSFRGIPAQMLRNNIRNNIEFSKIKSQNRIGSFGIKGWISSA